MFCRIALFLSLVGSLPALADLPPGGTFTDDNGSVHEPNIEAIAAAQITAGCDASGTHFSPNSAVTHAEMATFSSGPWETVNPPRTRATSPTFPMVNGLTTVSSASAVRSDHRVLRWDLQTVGLCFQSRNGHIDPSSPRSRQFSPGPSRFLCRRTRQRVVRPVGRRNASTRHHSGLCKQPSDVLPARCGYEG